MSTGYIARVRENVPHQLRELPVWLLWKWINRGTDDERKVPFYVDGKPRTGAMDTPEDRSHFVDFETAATAYSKGNYTGLGIVLGEVPGEEIRLSGIDLDDVIHDDRLSDRALQIVAAAESYAERSPSGNGVKVFGVGAIGTSGKVTKNGSSLELYDCKRFFTVTGDRLNGAHIADLSEAAIVARSVFPAPAKPVTRELQVSDDTDDVNKQALANLSRWVTELLPSAQLREDGTYRVTAKSLGRDTQEDMVIAPGGIMDYGATHETTRETAGRTPVEIVMARRNVEYPQAMDWLRERLGMPAFLAARKEQAASLPVDSSAGTKLEIRARHISEIIATPSRVRWLIRDELERAVIAVLAGKRGTFKSSVSLHWSMRAALAGDAVLIVSAEGAGLDRRILAWLKKHAPDANRANLHLYAIDRRVDFNSDEAIEAVLEEIARLSIKPALIVIDTLSKNSGRLDADKNHEVAQFMGRIDLRLRTPLDCTVLIVAHTGHGDQTRARGASAIEADTDSCYITTKPAEGLVSVTRERFKDAPELPPLNYRVEVIDLGYTDEDGKPVTSCALVATDDPPQTERRAELRSKAARQILAAVRVRNVARRIWTLADLRTVGRELGQHKNTAASAVEALTFSQYMTPTVGGYLLND